MLASSAMRNHSGASWGAGCHDPCLAPAGSLSLLSSRFCPGGTSPEDDRQLRLVGLSRAERWPPALPVPKASAPDRLPNMHATCDLVLSGSGGLRNDPAGGHQSVSNSRALRDHQHVALPAHTELSHVRMWRSIAAFVINSPCRWG